MGALIVGVLLFVVSGVVWSGVVKPPTAFIRGFASVPWTVLPAFGLLLCTFGLERVHVLPRNSPVAEIAFVIMVAAFIMLIWDPQWWGPRWYRESR